MSRSSFVQVIQLSPFVISKFSNKVLSVSTANNVCCIRTVGRWIVRNTAKHNDYFVWWICDVIFRDLLWTERELRTIGPFHCIQIKKLRCEGTIGVVFRTSNSECFSFVVCKATCVSMRVLRRFYRLVLFAIETGEYIFPRIEKRLLTNDIIYHRIDENTAKLWKSAHGTYCMLDNWGRNPYPIVLPIDSQLFC